MRLIQSLVSLTASALAFANISHAHSQSRNPLNYLTVLENPQISTSTHRVNAFSEFDITFDLHKQSQHIRLSLEPNHDILAPNARVEYIDEFGNVRHSEKIVREDHKVYMGNSWIREEDGSYSHVGWARIVVRRDGVRPLFEGAFTILGDHHHIQMKENYLQTKHEYDPMLQDDDEEYMTVFRDSDISRSPATELKRSVDLGCQADKLEFNSNPNHPVYQNMLKLDKGYWGSIDTTSLLGKRQSIDGGGTTGGGNSGVVNLKSNIGNTAGCPSTRKVALLGVATDCSYTGAFNSTDTTRQNIITQVNTASALYQASFNITLGLQNLTVSDAQCPSTASSSVPWNVGCGTDTITDRLNLFSQWRGQRPDSNAYWSLFSTCNTGAEVGLAWLGQLCNNVATTQSDTSGSSQTVSGANVVVRTSTEWQVFAHETGHTFGAVHDCDVTTCADASIVNSQQCCPLSASTCDANAQYIMNPYAAGSITNFSPCTIGNICSALGSNSVKSTCLSDNRGVATISGQQCGNGIVEEGEECDCGGVEGCAGNICCNPTTCKFDTGAVCDPSNEGCCTTTCQFSSAGTICRASTGQCDPAETCAGNTGTCPPDKTTPDGTSCGTSGQGLECASGQCTSRDLQCKTLMGSYTSDNDTYACNSETCTLSCASPSFGANVCYSMQQNFLDGTPCGGGGKCENGQCQGSTTGGEIKSWIDDNKTLVIAIASAIGGLILLAILGCIWRACRRPRKTKAVAGRRPRRARTEGWDGPMPNPDMMQRGYGSGLPGEWHPPQPSPYNPQPYGNPGWGMGPIQPNMAPPMYTPHGGKSVRYA